MEKFKTYNTRYELLIDLPKGQKKGDKLNYSVNRDSEIKYYFMEKNGVYMDMDNTVFSLEEVKNENFFKPIGTEIDLIKPFPNQTDFKEAFYLLGESRFIETDDNVRLINPIFNSEEFYNRVFSLLKEMYNEKYFNIKPKKDIDIEALEQIIINLGTHKHDLGTTQLLTNDESIELRLKDMERVVSENIQDFKKAIRNKND